MAGASRRTRAQRRLSQLTLGLRDCLQGGSYDGAGVLCQRSRPISTASIAIVATKAVPIDAKGPRVTSMTPIAHGSATPPSAAPPATIDVMVATRAGNRSAPTAIMLGKIGPNPNPISATTG